MAAKGSARRSIQFSRRTLLIAGTATVGVALFLVVGLRLYRTLSGAWATCPQLGLLGPATLPETMPVPALAQDEQVYQLFISGSPVEAVALSPDGLKAAAASGDFVTIWDIRDGGPSFDAADRQSTRLNSSHQLISY